MWLKILSSSSGGYQHFDRNQNGSHRHDELIPATNNPKEATKSLNKSKSRRMAQSAKIKALKSRSSAETPKMPDREANKKATKALSGKTSSNTPSIFNKSDDSKAGCTSRYWENKDWGLMWNEADLAGKTESSEERSGIPRGFLENLEDAALETTSTITQTTSASSISDKSENQAHKDDHKVIIEKRLTEKAQKARRSRRDRLRQRHKKNKNTPSRRLKSRNKRGASHKKDAVSISEESTVIMIEGGNDCFLMTKDDVNDLVDTFYCIAGKGKGDGFCDCEAARNIVKWFIGEPVEETSQSRSEVVGQATNTFMGSIKYHAGLTKRRAEGQDASKTSKNTCCVDDDMSGSKDTSDSSLTSRTPKIQNTKTKFVDEDMASTLQSREISKMAPIEARMIEKSQETSQHQFQSTNMIQTDELVVAFGEQADGQANKATIEAVLLSEEKKHDNDSSQIVFEDSEYGDDEEDVPDDEASDAARCANGHKMGFMFDIEQDCHWDYGRYKVNSRDGVKMPTIHEVDIDTIIYENGDENDFCSFDLSSITPESGDDSIETTTTGTGEALSPILPPTTLRKVDLNRQLELNRRLKELEMELSRLQGQYEQLSKSCVKVETKLQSPSVSGCGEDGSKIEEEHFFDKQIGARSPCEMEVETELQFALSDCGVEEYEEAGECFLDEHVVKSCEKVETHHHLPSDNPLSAYGKVDRFESYKEEEAEEEVEESYLFLKQIGNFRLAPVEYPLSDSRKDSEILDDKKEEESFQSGESYKEVERSLLSTSPEFPLFHWGMDGGVEESKEEECCYNNDDGVMSA